MSLTDQFKKELAVIKTAKLTFLVGFVVLTILIGWGEYSFGFKEWLASKDGIIKDKNETIEGLKQKLIDAQKIPAPPEPKKPSKSFPKIEQHATDSNCSNVVAGRDAKLDCSPAKENKDAPGIPDKH
jgi:hypothetical protein